MSREDNKLPPIGPKPGQEPWGYDEKFKPQGTLEERMDFEEIEAQLEQRFQLRQGATIKPTGKSVLARLARFEVVAFNGENVELRGINGKVTQTYPAWFMLYQFNLGEWEVIE